MTMLSPAARVALLRLGVPRRYGDGQRLFHQGSDSVHAVLLTRATIKVTATTEDGRVILLALRHSGDLVGEIASLDSHPRPTTAIAVGAADVRLIRQPDFVSFLAEHPDATLALGRSIAAKLRGSIQRRAYLTGLPVKTRVVRVLSEYAHRGGRAPTGTDRLVLLSQEELASLIGASKISVHRSLASLKRRGVISTGYRSIMIHNIDGLQAELATPDEDPEGSAAA